MFPPTYTLLIRKHTKTLRVGTLFEDDDGLLWRVVQGKTNEEGYDDPLVFYVDHLAFLDDPNPPKSAWENSTYKEVKNGIWSRLNVLRQEMIYDLRRGCKIPEKQ